MDPYMEYGFTFIRNYSQNLVLHLRHTHVLSNIDFLFWSNFILHVPRPYHTLIFSLSTPQLCFQFINHYI